MDKEKKPESNKSTPEAKPEPKPQTTPETKPETTPEVKSETVIKSKSGKKPIKTIISIFAILLLLGGVVLGYGFFKGLQTKNYATKVESIYNASKEKWTPDHLDLSNDDYSNSQDFSDKMGTIKDDTSSALNEISKLKETSKTKSLRQNAKDYYTKAKQYAESGNTIAEYFVTLEETEETFNKISETSYDTSSFVSLATEYKKIKDDIDNQVKTLENTTPPDSFKDFHKDLISALKEFSDALDSVISALESGSVTALESAISDTENIVSDFYSISMPDTESIEEDLASENERNELSSLGDKISNEASNLKKKIFVLF